MSCNSTGDGVEEGRPATARFEFVGGFVERCIAAHAGVDARAGSRGVVLVVFAGVGCFCTLFADDAELFWWGVLVAML